MISPLAQNAFRRLLSLKVTALLLACSTAFLPAVSPGVCRAAGGTFIDVVASVQPKMVKIYGAGGLRGLEAYQSGFLISPAGHVLTVWSYVLDTDNVAVTLDDGRKFQAQLIGADPRREIAVLKIDADGLPHFRLSDGVELSVGDRVLAFSNLFGVAAGDEDASVLHGCVSAKTQLAARRGAFETPYDGPVYVVDAMTNNPGSAGGVLTDRQGNLVGILGKELRNALNNTWLNYAIPAAELVTPVDDILAGKTLPRKAGESAKRPDEPWTLARAGLRLVPDVLSRTPPFIDAVAPDSPAARAKLQPDDLILFVNNGVVVSYASVVETLSLIDHIDPVRLTVQRGQQLVDVVLEAKE
ncbi:MAG TPA: trypsin-like peptidase domain-containing protein [Candidatus Anammoximicrobium sp.]|nr:trypsin-like peptidase domain-containing protein [Candidatus Anammoximicrobium sp.]